MQIKKLNSRAVVPSKQIGNAGFDLAVLLPTAQELGFSEGKYNSSFLKEFFLKEDGTVCYKLYPRERKTFGTGLAVWLQNPRLVGLIASRSKLGTQKGIVVTQGFGTLDSNYQGELMISLHNISEEPFIIEDGMLVAQLIVCEMPLTTHFTEVADFFEETDRGAQGINCEDLRIIVETAYMEGEL